MKRTAPVISFLVLVACGALCQSARLTAERPGDNSHSAEGNLPDAPLVQPALPELSHQFVDQSIPRSTPSPAAVNVEVARRLEMGSVPFGPQVNLAAPEASVSPQKDSSIFFDKYLYPSLRRGKLGYQPSPSNSLMGRAAYAASRFFVTRDDSGKGKLNTSYLLGVVTSVTVDNAYRPYWARSTSSTFSNFGSTIGSDAGNNLLHEFGPGIRQLLQGHAPKFVSNIVTHYQDSREVLPPVR